MERQEVREGGNSCVYRLVQEGLPFLLPFLTRQVVSVSTPALLRILRERSLPIPHVVPTADAAALAAGDGAAAAAAAAPPAAAAPAEDAPGDAPAPPALEAAGVKRTADGAAVGAPSRSGQAKLEEPAFLAQLPDARYGCCVITLADDDATALGLPRRRDAAGALTANAPVALVCWRARASLNVLVSKPECAQLEDKILAAQRRMAAAAAAKP